jgi:hypothetical protein
VIGAPGAGLIASALHYDNVKPLSAYLDASLAQARGQMGPAFSLIIGG